MHKVEDLEAYEKRKFSSFGSCWKKIRLFSLSAAGTFLIFAVVTGIKPPENQGKSELEQRILFPKAKSESESSVPGHINHNRGEIWTEPTTGMTFVWIPPGEFLMGSESDDAYDNEKPVHKVNLDGFWMGAFEVTQGEWESVMGRNPSYFKKGPKYPVEMVSWGETQEFISRLNKRNGTHFRLPTEEEWEYACRVGTKVERYGELDEIAWYDGNSENMTHPVGEKRPNAWELYDMLGNVWEWCQDVYKMDYLNSPWDNPLGLSSGADRVSRGGSCFGAPRDVRASIRVNYKTSRRFYNLGFRLARE